MDQRRRGGQAAESFRDFEATVLFCPRCRAPQPVRERLLLILPDGELREYLCTVCSSSLGTRRINSVGGSVQ